jgi:3alpha(or 20beta)-hydroxysteroid dehydrogenase
MGRLENKVAIVTGGAQGQGAAIARPYVAEGAKVVIADVAKDEGQALADELGENAHFVHHDVSDQASWTALVEDTNQRFGPVNVLANNAGLLRFGEIETMPIDELELLFRVNQLGCFLGMQAVTGTMKANGGGSIINASSVEGLAGMPYLTAYTSTKFAIRGMTKVAALELGPHGIRVNSVHPGMIETDMVKDAAGGHDIDLSPAAKRIALRRMGQSEDIAEVVLFLACDRSSYVTGAEVAADGGATATHAFYAG